MHASHCSHNSTAQPSGVFVRNYQYISSVYWRPWVIPIVLGRWSCRCIWFWGIRGKDDRPPITDGCEIESICARPSRVRETTAKNVCRPNILSPTMIWEMTFSCWVHVGATRTVCPWVPRILNDPNIGVECDDGGGRERRLVDVGFFVCDADPLLFRRRRSFA